MPVNPCQVVVADPCGQPNPRLVAAALDAGALGVLDLPRSQGDPITEPIAEVARMSEQPFAIRLPFQRLSEASADLADQVSTVIVTGPYEPSEDVPGPEDVHMDGSSGARAVWFEVVSRDEARFALDQGAAGLIAKGCESGGRVGDVESFVLLQQIAQLVAPFWVQGGIAEHTAAAAIVGGAQGVVLDGQLALLRESQLPETTCRAIAAMDGSETRVIGGHRLYTRPDIPAAALLVPEADTSCAHVAERLGKDIHHDLVPLGQDAATASDLAERHATVAGAVQAIRQAITDHIATAARHEPLSPSTEPAQRELSARTGSRVLGTRYPVAQGPMTRVSDQPELALAVAEAGGHPFMALALLSGADTRALLTATRELLGDHPWGVGILGFVPPEVRAAQLEVLQEIQPATALIAGGRPAHARPLEEAGIRTFLHVPSPGLLDHFLAEGARRFVFEGRECGGHVGPRASFPLWDAQIRRLLAVENAENLDVLFAGGIHDARSAAMVASVAAPLAARGAAIGVLMGTAYLFTEEAVSTSAVTATFQDMARECQRTALLETGPGHVTRCIESEYVRTFSTRKAELEADGVAPSEVWADLEAFNLGRLRVATKGVARQGKQIVPVDDEEQRQDGLYMIGQVATLRDQPTRIADLHEDVTAGATAHLVGMTGVGALATPQAQASADPGLRAVGSRPADPSDDEVAIVGMAAVFPGAADTDQYWANILGGVDCVSEVPRTRWDPDRFEDSTPSRWGGFLPWVPFDALQYGIPPRSLASIESVQLLSLEVAARALEDAGYGDRSFNRERASVIFGAEGGNDLAHAYGFRAAYRHFLTDASAPIPPALDQHLPRLTEDSFPGVLTNVIAGRIANRLDLGGANYTVDAACAASLAALDAACKELATGGSDMVLCGAADVHNSIHDYLMFASVHALSPTGRCRTFDSSADGIVLGEGVACIVLKRLADAGRDGDRVYAVVEGIGSASDGRHLGLTAPRQSGQTRTLTRAYERAGVPPSTVGLVEAHGTGTVVGDRTELAALTEVFSGARHAAEPHTVALGSVKSQIGHTKCAAGLAGLIKVTHAVYTGVLPPTCNIESPNGFYQPEDSPFRFLDGPAPWATRERRAGVSAFGFGGTNFHAVLSSRKGGERPRHGLQSWPAELFLIRAADAGQADRRLEDLRRVVDRILAADPEGERHRLRDLAWTVSASGDGPVQAALVAEDFASLSSSCAQATGTAQRSTVPKTAFLYPGQGSQYPGMLGELFAAFPRLQSVLELDTRTTAKVFGGRAFTDADRAARDQAVADTSVAQPALGLAALAVTQLLHELGVRPDAVAGHSYGELPALVSAGAIDHQDLIRLSHARAQAMVSAVKAAGDPGAMAAVALPDGELRSKLAREPGNDGVVVANLNAPGQSVVSGPTTQVEALITRLAADGIGARRLAVSAAFHSPLMAGAAQAFAAELAGIQMRAPALPVWSAASAKPYPEAPDEARALLADQLTMPVRFVEQVEDMYAAGIRVFVEAGPGDVLTNLVGRILAGRPHLAVSCDPGRGGSGLRHLLETLAQLAASGVPVDVGPLLADRAHRLDLDELPLPAPGWRANGHLVCQADGTPVEGGLQPADRIGRAHTDPAGMAAGSVERRDPYEDPLLMSLTEVTMEGAGEDRTDREAVVQEYLASMRDLARAQREVVLRYLDDVEGDPLPPKEERSSQVPARDNGRTAYARSLRSDQTQSTPELAGVEPDRQVPGRQVETPQDNGPSQEELMATVLAVVAERTGYPEDMLDPDLDLEADLSIDSIKRIEIIGQLARRLDLPGADGGGIDDRLVEELASLKTLRAVVSWLEQHVQVGGSAEREPAGDGLNKLLFETVSLPPAAPGGSTGVLAGQRLAVVSDPRPGLNELVRSLQAAGAQVQVLPVHRGAPNQALPDQVATRLGRIDGLVHLGPADARDVFAVLRPALAGHCTTVVAVTAAPNPGTDGPHLATGVTGLIRALAHELPDRSFRVVELDSAAVAENPDGPGTAVRLLAGEVITAWQTQQVRQAQQNDTLGPLWVTYRDGTRATRQLGKAVPVEHSPPHLALDADSVVVVTGGARGITAECALALARATGCQLVLLGRSPLPSADEDPATATAGDRPALRRTLVARLAAGPETRKVTPAQVEAECDRILAAREIRATLETLDRLGTSADYHQVDVSDTPALEQALDAIRERHGHIDAIVHGAGVIEDRLAADKSDASFNRVFATKVDAAHTLLTHLRDDVRLVALFGSISGVYGNRGQTDYSAANDALGELASRYDGIDGRRVVCVHWGPWAGAGMVTPELERSYSRQGIGLIPAEAGAAAFLQELATLPGEPAEVVIAGAGNDEVATDTAGADASGSSPRQIDADPAETAGRPVERPVTLEDLTMPDTPSTVDTTDADRG